MSAALIAAAIVVAVASQGALFMLLHRRLRNWSITARSLVAAVVVLALAAVWQARALGVPLDSARVLRALLIPQAVAALCATLWTWLTVRHRTARLVAALRRIEQGELRGEVPPAIDDDLVRVRDALLSMRASIDQLTARLRHTDAQRRRLFADLAHELATPTSTILAVADALADPAKLGAETERGRLVACLDGEGTRLERLVSDIRDLARLDDPDVALEPQRVDLGEIARRAAERINVAGGGARVTCAAEAVPALADPVRIDQVMINLLTNAQRYTPPDGTIAVRVERRGGEARLTVEDSGVGVPDEVLPRLGERLLRVDPSRARRSGGHGLGLSIVSAVVQRHGGRLRFDRASLGGLRVEIDLPAAADQAERKV